MLRFALVTSCLFSVACDEAKPKEEPNVAEKVADPVPPSKLQSAPKPEEKPKLALPPPALAEAHKAVEAIASASEEQKPRLAAKALEELESERLEEQQLKMFAALDAGPEQRAVLLARSISENITLLDEACGTDARRLMSTLATMPPDSREQAIWDGCRFERHGLVEAGKRPELDAMMAIVAHIAFMRLRAGGDVSEPEQTLLKTMMQRVDDAEG